MPDTEILKQHLRAYGTVWLVAFLLVMAGTLVSNLIFRVTFISVTDVLLSIAFFSLIILSTFYLIVELFSDRPITTKLALCIAAVLLFLPLMYAPVLALDLYDFFGKQGFEGSRIYNGFQTELKETSAELAKRAGGGKYVSWSLGVLQVAATVVGTFAAAMQVSQMLRRRNEKATKS